MSKVTLYGADWCGPCQRFKPHFKEASHGYLVDLGVSFEYRDIDEMDPAELQEKSIFAVPTVLFEHEGEVHQVKPAGRAQFEMEIEHLMKLA